MNIDEILMNLAAKQLNKASTAVEDGAWFDDVISKIEVELNQADLPIPVEDSTREALEALKRNRDQVTKLGIESLTLLVKQLSIGDATSASQTFVQATGTADDIISAMANQTKGLIEAKKRLDEMYAEALRIVREITIAGARQLLPYLLSHLPISM